MTLHNSDYIEKESKDYALYVVQERAIPHLADGLKSSARRVLWTARDGKKIKSLTLAGATLPLHPHGLPESSINTMAAFYGNNIPLLHGDGAFGTLLNPKVYGATRYTYVLLSKFTKDVIMVDMDIIPMVDNYDGTLMEPKHFLPLVPITIINPQEGIAIGYSSHILSRSPETIIKNQIDYLEGKKLTKNPPPTIIPLNQIAITSELDKKGNTKWIFHGVIEIIDSTTVKITNLPYNVDHDDHELTLINLMNMEDSPIVKITDDSKDEYNIVIKFKRGAIAEIGEDNLLKYLGLVSSVSENLNVIDFCGERVLKVGYIDIIEKFTEWRLQWYVKRYQRLRDLTIEDIQKYNDIITAIDNDVGGKAKTIKDRGALVDFCKSIGIINTQYIADFPVYRFTKEEKNKVLDKIQEANSILAEYNALLKSDSKRKEVYIKELTEIRDKIKKGYYK